MQPECAIAQPSIVSIYSLTVKLSMIDTTEVARMLGRQEKNFIQSENCCGFRWKKDYEVSTSCRSLAALRIEETRKVLLSRKIIVHPNTPCTERLSDRLEWRRQLTAMKAWLCAYWRLCFFRSDRIPNVLNTCGSPTKYQTNVDVEGLLITKIPSIAWLRHLCLPQTAFAIENVY